MTLLLTSDLHLTDSPRDEYRWSIFPWLAACALDKAAEAILILGDLTDRKDHHSSVLVNRLVWEFRRLAYDGRCQVHALAGNHDYADPDSPFFDFLNCITDVSFHRTYDARRLPGGERVLFLPHERGPSVVWGKRFDASDFPRADLVVCHQTFGGALASNGHELSGLSANHFRDSLGYDGPVVSGDIHVPQRLGQVTYCGAPHPVRFGDDYRPRVLVFRDGRLTSIPRKTIRKASLDIRHAAGLTEPIAERTLRPGDQLRVRLHLRRADFPDWPEQRALIQQVAADAGIVLAGVELVERRHGRGERRSRLKEGLERSAPDLFRAFCRSRSVPKHVRAAGAKLAKEDA